MLKKFFQYRTTKIIVELIALLLIYFAVKLYMNRDLAQGPLPAIQGNLLNGQAVDLQSYQGKPLLLHFWATWCGVCKLEEKSIDAISKEHAVLTIAMSSGSDQEINNYLNQHNLTFPVINDNNGQLAQRYGVSAVPTSFIINPDGEIAYTEVGYTTNWGIKLRLWLAE